MDPAVVAAACKAIATLVHDVPSVSLVVSERVVPVVVAGLDKDEPTATSAWLALTAIAHQRWLAVKSAGGIPAVIMALLGHLHDPCTMTHACKVLCAVAAGTGVAAEELAADGLQAVAAATSVHCAPEILGTGS